MPGPQPNPDPDGLWPSCDDERPGVSIRPLRHADMAALLADLDQHGYDPGDIPRAGPRAPMVAVRVRASVGQPGASAHAQYLHRRATELATWTRTLPWRVAVVLVTGLVAWLLTAQLVARLAAVATLVAAAGMGWALRFRLSPNALAWWHGAAGERRTAHLLAPLERRGWAVLHDLGIPGSAANIDHLVIGPSGVAVIHSKQYRGRLWLDSHGLLRHGRLLLVSPLRKVRWEADQADEVLGIADIQVTAVMAVRGTNVPLGRLQADGVIVVPARRVPDLLQALPPILGPERVAWLADRARLRFRAAA
jgi:hypothetical protein